MKDEVRAVCTETGVWVLRDGQAIEHGARKKIVSCYRLLCLVYCS